MKKHALMPLVFYLISMAAYYLYSFIKLGVSVPNTYIVIGYGLIVIPIFSIFYGYISGRANKNSVAPTLTNSITAGLFSLSPYIVSLINKNEDKLFLAMSAGVVVIVGLLTYFPAAQGAKRGKEKAEKNAEKEAQKLEKKQKEEAKQKEEEIKRIEVELKEKLAKEKEEEFEEQIKAKTQEEINAQIKEMGTKE